MKRDFITLKVISLIGSTETEIHFRIQMATPLRKIFNTFAEKIDVPVEILRFLYDGKLLNPRDTVKSLELEDDDCIEVHMRQTSGGFQP